MHALVLPVSLGLLQPLYLDDTALQQRLRERLFNIFRASTLLRLSAASHIGSPAPGKVDVQVELV